jgi:Dihydrodipicolinate synthetase family
MPDTMRRRSFLRLALAGVGGAAVGVPLNACGADSAPDARPDPSRTEEPAQVEGPGRILLAYFSRPGENYWNGGRRDLKVGNTEVLAGAIRARLDCDVHRIEAVDPYPARGRLQAALEGALGWDTLTFAALAAGVRAVVWGVASIVPEQCVELHRLLIDDIDLPAARELWARLWPLCQFLESQSYPAAVKTACGLVGDTTGPVRPPLLPLDQTTTSELSALVDHARLAEAAR